MFYFSNLRSCTFFAKSKSYKISTTSGPRFLLRMRFFVGFISYPRFWFYISERISEDKLTTAKEEVGSSVKAFSFIWETSCGLLSKDKDRHPRSFWLTKNLQSTETGMIVAWLLVRGEGRGVGQRSPEACVIQLVAERFSSNWFGLEFEEWRMVMRVIIILRMSHHLITQR